MMHRTRWWFMWQVLKLESERQNGVLGGTVADYGAAHKQAPHL